MSRIRKLLNWKDWSPGLDINERKLGPVAATLPGAPPEKIPWLVRLLENPASPVAFPGKVNLEEHDIIHVLLGRGLSLQDEAFVLGFTMGHDPASFRYGRIGARWCKNLFLFLARLYPRVYRFDDTERAVFRRAFWEGRKARARQVKKTPGDSPPLNQAALGQYADRPIGEVRRMFGISIERLRTCYRIEKLEYPDRNATRRLDVSAVTDYVDILPPEGPDSDWKKETR